MTTQYTTNTTRRASGNASDALKVCEGCHKSFIARRRWARFCSPTCRARAFDAAHGRTSNTAKTEEGML